MCSNSLQGVTMQHLNRQKHTCLKASNLFGCLMKILRSETTSPTRGLREVDAYASRLNFSVYSVIALSGLGALKEYIKCGLAFSCPINPRNCLKDILIIEA